MQRWKGVVHVIPGRRKSKNEVQTKIVDLLKREVKTLIFHSYILKSIARSCFFKWAFPASFYLFWSFLQIVMGK